MTVEGSQLDKSNFVIMFGPGRFTVDLGYMHQNNVLYLHLMSNLNNEVKIVQFCFPYDRLEGTQFDKSNFVIRFGQGWFTLDLGSMHQTIFFSITPHVKSQ